ncbi:MAG: ribosomal protein S18-alanine N-acetyltransferase [Candidatus Sericytochromatia bacterium]|nr:ribosomal protein S18-alanine N-acetyltransferase [Candidatus Sericytochromatia bacterium]
MNTLALTIEPMQQRHIAALQPLERLCFGKNWTPTDFGREMQNERYHYFVITDQQTPVAYLGYWQILEEAHITSVGVHPDYRKQRLAQRLMCHMLADCQTRQINWITLEVKASNLEAQKLYEKFGFAVMGRRKNYYQADREDALIMWTENIASSDYQARLEKLKAEIH